MAAAYRRIYDTAVKKFILGTGIPLGMGFIWLLAALGAITITGFSGDVVCRGDDMEPCYAYVNFTANTDVFLYINDTTLVSNNQSLKDLIIQRSWRNGWRTIPTDTGSTGSWCGCSWCRTDNPSTFSYAFRAGKDYQLRIIAYKNDPMDSIKWGFGDWKTWQPADPIWLPDHKERYLKLIKTEADLTWAYTEYEVCNPTQTKYMESMKLDWYGKTSIIKSTKLMVEEAYEVNEEVPVYSINKVCREPYANETQKICHDESVLTGYTQIKTTDTRWVEWDGKLDGGKCIRVMLYADLKPALGTRDIDHVPEVFSYKYKEYDWWSATWTRRKGLDLNTTTDMNNFQEAVTVAYDSDMKSDFSDIRVLSNCSDDAVEMNIWNESQTASSRMIMWINTSTVGSNNTYCMYYGNSGASSAFSINTTGFIGDDFEDKTLGNVVGQDNWKSNGVGDWADFDVVTYNSLGGKSLHVPTVGTTGSVNISYPATLNSGVTSFMIRFNGSGTPLSSIFDYWWGAAPYGAIHWVRTSANAFLFATAATWVTKPATYDEYYKINMTWTNVSAFTGCVMNSTMTFCTHATNYASRNQFINFLVLTADNSAGAGSHTHWDNIFVGNITNNSFKYSFGAEEEYTPPAAKVTQSNATGDIEYGTIVRFNTTSDCITDLYRTNCTTNPKLDIAVYPALYGRVYNITNTSINITDDSEDSYSCSGTFSAYNPCSNAVDEDLNTYAICTYSLGSGCLSYIYENYSIPYSTNNATWYSKAFVAQAFDIDNGIDVYCYDYSSSTFTLFGSVNATGLWLSGENLTENFFVPFGCLDGSTLQIKTSTGKQLSGLTKEGYYDGNVSWQITSRNSFDIEFNNNYINVLDAMINITPTNVNDPPKDIKIDVINDGKYDAELEGTLYATGRMFLNETTEENHPFNITDGIGVFYVKLYPGAKLVIANITIGNNTPTQTVVVDTPDDWYYTGEDGGFYNPEEAVDSDWDTHATSTSTNSNIYENYTIPTTMVEDSLGWKAGIGGHFGYPLPNPSPHVNITAFWFNWNTNLWVMANNCYDTSNTKTGACGTTWYNYSIDTSDFVNSDNVFSTRMLFDGNVNANVKALYYESRINYTLTAPVDVEIDTLNDGTNETYIRELNRTRSIALNMTGIQNHISRYNTSYVYVPISIKYSPAQINMSLYNITINYTVFNFTLNTTAINEEVKKNSTITVVFYSEKNITVKDLFVPYQGNGNITVFNFTEGSFSRLENYTLDVYWSNFSVGLPKNVYFPEFIPKTNTSKNVTPWGQTSTVPAFNITSLGYGKAMNFTIYVNESYDTCMNITVSNTSTKYGGKHWVLNTSQSTMFSDMGRCDSAGIWLWADLYGCPGRWLEWYPNIISVCTNCMGGW